MLTESICHNHQFVNRVVNVVLQGWFQQLKLPTGLQQEAPAPGYAALAALCAYLKRMHADQELATGAQLVMPYELYAAALCLDGPTLANLELLEGSGGEAEGSLLAALDSCASPGNFSAAFSSV